MTSREERHVAAWRAVLQTQSKVVRRIEADLAAAGRIPLTHYDVLLELRASPEGLRMADLGSRVVLSRTRVSRLVAELAAQGLLERRPDPDDGRGVRAVITPAGLAAMRAAAPVYLAGITAHFGAHLGQEEAAVITAALTRVIDATR